MNNFTSIAIKHDLPEISDQIVDAARSDPGLTDALKDYEQACERMNDAEGRPEDRALWAEIRTELASEIRRLYLAMRRDKNQQNSENDNR